MKNKILFTTLFISALFVFALPAFAGNMCRADKSEIFKFESPLQIEKVSEYATIATDRRALKRKLKRGKCSLAKTGSSDAQRACVRRALSRIDEDRDGIAKKQDNCDDDINNEQVNADGDLHGDTCDNCSSAANDDQADTDSDGHGNLCDNCPNVANDQANADADAHGDACDNCPSVANDDQADVDTDGIGNLCDADLNPSL